MAVESDYNTDWSKPIIREKQEEKIPYNKIAKFNYSEFKKDNIPLIRAQIETLLKKMIICPQMKPAYIQEINKIIKKERGEMK